MRKISAINTKLSDRLKSLSSDILTTDYSQRGVSLIEGVIVAAIAGMIILFLGNIASSLGLIGGSKQESVVNQIINKKMEGMRSSGYDNLANGTTQISDSRLNSLPNQQSQVIVEDCPPSICTNGELMKQVTIKVSWTSSNKNKQVVVKTLIAQGGLK